VQETIKITDKTQEQLMAENWEDLTLEEKALRSDLERHPKMTWENALVLSEMSPLEIQKLIYIYSIIKKYKLT